MDEIGGLEDAIKIAAQKAGITSYKTTEYPIIEDDIMTTIIKEISKGKGEDAALGLFATKDEKKLLQQYNQFRGILRMKEPQARLPYIFDFN